MVDSQLLGTTLHACQQPGLRAHILYLTLTHVMHPAPDSLVALTPLLPHIGKLDLAQRQTADVAFHTQGA